MLSPSWSELKNLQSDNSHQGHRRNKNKKPEALLLGIPRISWEAQATPWSRQLVLQRVTCLLLALSQSAYCCSSICLSWHPWSWSQTTLSWQATWGLAISRQEAGHSGLKTDLHSVRNRTALCCGGHRLLGWLRRGPTDSLSHSDVPTQGCQEVWLFWGQVSSVHPWISPSTPHSNHRAPNSESPQPCGPTRLFSGHRPVRGISGS